MNLTRFRTSDLINNFRISYKNKSNVVCEPVDKIEPCNTMCNTLRFLKFAIGIRISLTSVLPQTGRSWGADDASRHLRHIEIVRGGGFAIAPSRDTMLTQLQLTQLTIVWIHPAYGNSMNLGISGWNRVTPDTHGPLNALCRLRGGGGSGCSRYPWTDSRRRPLNSRRVNSYRMRASKRQCA